MRDCIKPFFIILCAVAAMSTVCSQPLADSIIKKIDGLYKEWNANGSPGCAVAIIRNDSLIYAKGFGMANLEYGINNSAQTIFHVASVSKQFTAWAIIQLARAGKLNLNDDIHKYLPWFPDLKTTITIRNLLNHTSGIRDQWQLAAISGTRLDDIITQDQVINILSTQQALNFKSGTRYLYSSSGYTMLAAIVKSVTGQTLRQFTDSAMFKPLGMSNTHFHDDYTEIEKNRAYSYTSNDGTHFSNAVLNYSNVGPTNLFTNVEDMSKWVANFYNHTIGDEKDIDTLTKNVMLNDGSKFSYACGIIVNKYKGWKQYSHAGTDAGFQSFVTVFPDKKMGFIVFSNSREFYPQAPAYSMADLFIDDTAVNKAKLPATSGTTLKDTVAVKKYAGDYIGDDGLPLSFDFSAGKFAYHLFDQSAALAEDSKDHYTIAGAPEIKIVFNISGKDTSLAVTTPDQSYKLKKYIKRENQPHKIMINYTGDYYCPELDCHYRIVLRDHNLYLTNAKYNVKLSFLNKDHLVNEYWWTNHLHILRDTKNNISGFEVNSNGIMHLRFDKIKGNQ